jgi:hypothetical protein
LLLLVLLQGAACDRRAIVSADGSDAFVKADAPGVDAPVADAAVDAVDASPRPCQRLTVAGQATLGRLPDHLNVNADVTDDDNGFAAIWISGEGSSGELLFARLDHAGAVQDPRETVLATDASKIPKPLIAHHRGTYAAFYRTASGSVITRFDEMGKASTSHTLDPPAEGGALAADASGFAMLYAPLTTGVSTLVFARLDDDGLAAEQNVDAGGDYFHQWLAPRANGFSAAWGDRLVLLDGQGAPRGPAVETFTATAVSGPSYAATGNGYGVVYARSIDLFLEGQRLDAAGRPQGDVRPIAQAGIGAAPLQQLFLFWTGSHYLLAYPGDRGGARARVQVLDAELSLVGEPAVLPGCLSWDKGPVSAAFGNGRLAVAYIGGLSGPPGSAVCIAIVACGD